MKKAEIVKHIQFCIDCPFNNGDIVDNEYLECLHKNRPTESRIVPESRIVHWLKIPEWCPLPEV